MMRSPLASLRSDRAGVAAAEMALVTPLLMILMFGSLEIGKFFLDEHVVVKAVRDGARFAARQGFATMPCGGVATNETQIKNLVRYGKVQPVAADPLRLHYWTSAATVTITIDCYANAGVDGDRVFGGVYSDRATVPRVTVAAAVPYQPLVGAIGFNTNGLVLNASNQAAVFGI